jgi:6-pyruvoyl-tetrahydropterin synthase
MVVDFSNLKKYMMDILDSVFDHGFVIYHKDNAMMNMYFPGRDHAEVSNGFADTWKQKLEEYEDAILEEVKADAVVLPRTMFSVQDPEGMKVIVVNYVPTAENLAKHMYDMLKPVISAHYGDDTIRLVNIRLWETPNGWVDFPGTMYNL